MTPGDKENWIRGGEHDLENGLSTPLLNVAPKAHFVRGREGRSPPRNPNRHGTRNCWVGRSDENQTRRRISRKPKVKC